jgi:hypothetical protein
MPVDAVNVDLKVKLLTTGTPAVGTNSVPDAQISFPCANNLFATYKNNMSSLIFFIKKI